MGNLLEIDNLISKDKKLNNICEKIQDGKRFGLVRRYTTTIKMYHLKLSRVL